MLIPASTFAGLLLLILTLFCWGSWANSQKYLLKWRFELFYYDFSIGVLACVLLAALTLGSMNPQELTVSDNLLIASYRKIAIALGAGVLVNFAYVWLSAATSVAGMAVAFPISFGIGLIVMSISDFIGNPAMGNALVLVGGLVLVVAAIVIDVIAYHSHLDSLKEASKLRPVLDPRTRQPARSSNTARGVLLGVLSGIALGFFFPIVDSSREGDGAVGPYTLAALIGFGMFFSTLLYMPFFMNFPVRGEPLQLSDYFKGTRKQHLWGILGGVVWAVGLVAALAEAAAPPAVKTGQALTFGLLQAVPVVAALWGLLIWREVGDSTQGVKMLILGTLVLYLAGLAMVSLSPVLAR
jgi:glucose uptake protein